MVRTMCLALAASLIVTGGLRGQDIDSPAPVVDTVVIVTGNVFTPEQSANNFFFRAMNAIHIVTKQQVIWKELLFRPGEAYDSVKLAESERLLRAREIFRRVHIDSMRIGDRLAVIVDTQDGWSTKPNLKLTVATDGTWTGQFGLSEINLLGSGNLAHAAYVKDTDRRGLQLAGDFRRLLGSPLEAAGSVNLWNDGPDGFWRFGDAWVSNLDSKSILYDGEAADRRILQYRIEDAATPDTTFYQHEFFTNRLTGAFASRADAERYLRLGAKAEVRQEKYYLQRDSLLEIPDTVYGELGLFGEYSHSRFKQISYFNGFGDEDIDISTRLRLTLNLAASGLGYRRTGIGPQVEVSTGTQTASTFLVSSLKASGLLTEAGLDSGRVVLDLTFGLKPLPRHSTALYVSAGAQENPPPGQEFDLGFQAPPRSWEPHSFVGTRMIWGTVEHRWYALEALLDLISIGFAAFFDYGGAWYDGQDARFGGNIGIGLRMGGALSTAARTGRIDFGCRIGENSDLGDRCVATLGAGFVFPWNPRAADLVQRTY
ncbi:MAG: hypothetical protein JSU87_16470 [Gemmatimonadota bacterium]|nr:MAG: hypothetical protein JSU87_16470 [Gemmatimonadota bacterium]